MRAEVLLLGLLWLSVLCPRAPPRVGPPGPRPTCRWIQAPDGLRCSSGPGDGRRMAPARLAALSLPVDLNRASLEELASLDGVGPRLAERIVAARPFAVVDDVVRVRGIGAGRLARLRPRLTVSLDE